MKNKLLFFGLVIQLSVFAQPGSLDVTFGSAGKLTTNLGGNDKGQSVLVQPDGKIIVAGSSDIDTAVLGSVFALTRYNSDGTLDFTFDGDGKVTTDFGTATAVGKAVCLQSDGKIVVAGYSYNGSDNDLAIARYNNNGSLDNTFDLDGMVITDFGTSDEGLALAIQPDGKIIVAGVSYIPLDQDFAVYRYNSNGSVDATFDGDGKAITDFLGYFDVAYTVAIQSDGRIVLSGYSYNGVDSDIALVRYNSNGSLDNTFDSDGKVLADFGGADDIATTIAIQSDGKLVVAGFTDTGINIDFALTRFNNNGTPDNTFDSDGKTTTDFGSPNDIAYSVAMQSDGKIVLAGCSIDGTSGYDFALARYNSDGSPDMSFDSDGKLITVFGAGDDYGCSMAIQPDNKIVVAGMSYDGSFFDFAVARYHYVVTETDFIYKEGELEIYPNPSIGIFTLNNIPADANICVYDVVGNCVWNKEYSKGSGFAFIDLSTNAKGIYFLEIKKDGEQIVKKLVLR